MCLCLHPLPIRYACRRASLTNADHHVAKQPWIFSSDLLLPVPSAADVLPRVEEMVQCGERARKKRRISTFKYKNITDEDGIRLIQLHPRGLQRKTPEDTPIQCELIDTTLSKYDDDLIDQYTALSYV